MAFCLFQHNLAIVVYGSITQGFHQRQVSRQVLCQQMSDDLLSRQMQNAFRRRIVVSHNACRVDCHDSFTHCSHHCLQLFRPDLMRHQVDRYDIQHLRNGKQSRHHLLPGRHRHRFQLQICGIRLYFH